MIHVGEPSMHGNERAYLNACITKNQVSGNYFVVKFEELFRNHTGAPHALACMNGTAALHLALIGVGIEPGDEVIVPDLTYIASANAVRYCGARPVLVDVDPLTWNIDPYALWQAITKKTVAIMAVHLYGNLANMEMIQHVARVKNLVVIDDAAEAIGALSPWTGGRAGNLCDASAFSFYGNKIITCGEGGMVTFSGDFADTSARRAALYRGQGANNINGPYCHDVVGYNYRMTDLQAAVGLAQLEQIGWHLKVRAEVASWYRHDLENIDGVQFQQVTAGTTPSNWMVAIQSERSVAIAHACAASGIETKPFFTPIHMTGAYQEYNRLDFPVATRLYENGIVLPTHANLTRDDVFRVTDLVKAVVARG